MLRTWQEMLLRIVERLDDHFTLRDVLAQRDALVRAFPNNNNVDAKIRQQLQVLRDRKIIEFTSRGSYRRLVPRAQPTLYYESIDSSALKSASQIARVALEAWTVLNLRCRRCDSMLVALPPNTPISDVTCVKCRAEYQVKSKAGPFPRYLVGASHAKLLERLRSAPLPDYLLVEYDSRLQMVKYAVIIAGDQIDAPRIHARKELSANARRAGWIGARIDIENLDIIPVVSPSFIQRPAEKL